MEKIVVGPFNRGLRNDRTPFVIDNDSFPVLINAYQWRGRVKRKRGTSKLTRLKRFLGNTDGSGGLVVTILPIPIPDGRSSFVIGSDVFTDPGGASSVNLITNSAGTGTLDRATGVLTIVGSQPNTAVFYFPSLPVMGLEDLILETNQFPGTLAFDTRYSYNIQTVFPYDNYDVSFYKNPAVSASLPGYVPKATSTPVSWNGQDYQQFWTVNYEGALWATNGISVPFVSTNVGMQFRLIENIVIGSPTDILFTITNHGLVVGDFIFVNEVVGITGINFQTGYVYNVGGANTFSARFPNATIAGAYVSGGIAQYLTNRSDVTKDCLRWYDGDPTNGSATAPVVNGTKGWVNFCPPLSQAPYSIAEKIPAIYYLVTARMIVPFKDRLLFLGPVIQSSNGNTLYLQDTIIYSQNGTPYYTVSYTNSPNPAVDTPTSPTNVLFPILVPDNYTASPSAYFEDVTGFGGFVSASIDQPINTVSSNEDVLITGFSNTQARLVYSGNDISPFNFFLINSELGSSSTFSSINMDKGVITRGDRGYIITGQTEAKRIDLEIPDEVFQIRLVAGGVITNGIERICSQRDYINEWIYFSYPFKQIANKFPTQTLQYNYRDDSWAIFRETYTTYGSFRKQTGFTWATVGTVYPTWKSWNQPWNAGASTLLQPEVIAGNTQGFVIVRDDGTNEADSIYIQNIVGSVVTSPDHSLNEGDYITISGALGTVGSEVNGKIFSVSNPTQNTFTLNPTLSAGLTYLGGGLIKRMYIPFIQTKQFPVAWGMSRKTRIGPQQYLLTTTDKSEITLQIYLSQDADNAYNKGPIVPNSNVDNSSLVYSSVLYTCTESSNLGLTPANTNLQMISLINPAGTNASSPQAQIWHRMNTSLIGDTVQIGFTMSDAQMRDSDFKNQFAEIELHGLILDVSPSQILA
jgi:hypothetical protein